MLKWLGIVLGAMVLLVVGAGAYLFVRFEILASGQIERYASSLTQTRVTVDGVEVDFADDRGALTEVDIGNPPDFASPSALRFARVEITVDRASLTADGPVIFREMTFSGAEVIYEIRAGASNLRVLRENVAEALSSGGGAQGVEGDGRKVIIETLSIPDGRIAITHSALGGRTLNADLPEIRLTNLGADQGGLTQGEIASIVLRTVSGSTTRIATTRLVATVGPLEDIVREGIDAATPDGALDRVRDLIPGSDD